MRWTKEGEIAKSIHKLMTSRSIVGRNDFPDYDMFDAIRKRVSVEGQRAQKYDRFLRRRQSANMIYGNSVQPELMKRYKDSQICSVYVYRMTMSKISTFDGIKLYCQQAICLPM